MNEPKWLEWAQQLQAIAQTGLTYVKDVYDRERYEELRKLSCEIVQSYTSEPMARIETLFAQDDGYATPKVDVRAAVFRDGKILMSREKEDGRWTVPGGWADIGLSPSEAAVLEVKQETGYDVKPLRVIAVLDNRKQPQPPHPNHIYRLFWLCELVGGAAEQDTLETQGVGFFSLDELPELSTGRITESQVRLMFAHFENPERPVDFD
ncbi:NUDIX hydrolase [Tumebacillus flagellatus]|uniref:ADP-ribose pyrophosphatase n=1 Tax=Tumebacillus flagellatus TaxID=1157490 RepID=A0A074LUG0_9BACL|nr:NUDIX hydrolase [Tumebacillus flagellatus]KEO84220.1 ADP-ribose pyrophosphatase [Tumebacillus flagellatus]